ADFEGLEGITDVKERNAERLRLMDRARKVSLDARAVDPTIRSKEEGGKLEKVAENVFRIYKKWDADKGTQLVFLDRSVPKSKGDVAKLKAYDSLVEKMEKADRAGDERKLGKIIDQLDKYNVNEIEEIRLAQTSQWNAYQQIKDNLIAQGIPEKEIRFVQEANTDDQKKALFEEVNSGSVRVLIGSTPRMGAGTNVQERLVALHHGDVTWKPSDIEQREGRIIRQGNSLLEKYGDDNFQIEIIAYTTDTTVDAKLWSLNATKLKMINGIRHYTGDFNMEFEDEDSVGMAEIAAIASGEPLQLERVQLAAEIDRLKRMKKAFNRQMWGHKESLEDAKKDLATGPARLEVFNEFSSTIQEAKVVAQESADSRVVDIDGNKFYWGDSGSTDYIHEMAAKAKDDKAKFSVEVDGKVYRSKMAAIDAIDDVLGDRVLFDMTIDGKRHIRRKHAIGQLAGIANELIVKADGEEVDVEKAAEISYNGIDIDVAIQVIGEGKNKTIDFYFERDAKTKDGDKVYIVSERYSTHPDKDGFVNPQIYGAFKGVQGATDDIKHRVRFLKGRVDQASEVIPDLEKLVTREYPKDKELEEKSNRLEEVEAELSASAEPLSDSQAAQVDEVEGVFSTKTAITSEDGRAYILEDLVVSIFKAGQTLLQFSRKLKAKLGNTYRQIADRVKKMYQKLNEHLDKFTLGAEAGAIEIGAGKKKPPTKEPVKPKVSDKKVEREVVEPIADTPAASNFVTDKASLWINNLDPKWKDRWERLVYHWADRDDPKRLVQNRYGKQEEASNYLMAERLRGKKTAAETKRFSEEEVNPLLEHLAKSGLEIADLEEYAMVKHVPERNEQMRRINARQYLNTIASIKTGNAADDLRFNIANADSNIEKEERRDDYIDLLNIEFEGLDQLGRDIAEKGKALDNRKFTLEEERKGTPATLAGRQEAAEKRYQQLLEQKASWDDRSSNFAGMTDEESGGIQDKWESDNRFEDIESGRRMLAKINDGRLVDLVEGGEITATQANVIRSTYDYYMPFNRDGFVDGKPSSGRSTGPLGKAIKGAVGSQRKVVDILANSVANRQAAISRKHKALTGQKLYQLVKDNPDTESWWIEESPKQAGHDQDGNVIFYPEMQEPANGVHVKIDGKRYTIMVNHGDATMMRMMESIKDVDVGMGPIVQAMGKLTRLLASLNTTLSPEFIVTNLFRDLQTAGVNMEDSAAKGGQKKIAKNIPAAIKGIFKAERNKDSKWGRIYRDFEKNGGKIGWMQSYDNVADLAKELGNEMKLYQEGNTTKKALRKLSDLLEASNVAIENGVRLSTYDHLVNTMGINKREAALTVSNLTVDFTRRGAAGPNLNALYMFANAGIQGNIRMIKAAVRSSSVRKMLGAIVATGFAMHFLALATGGDDEDGIPFYDKIDDSEKERNIIFMLEGGKKIKIPMPYGYNIFYAIGDELAKGFATNMAGKEYKQTKGMARLASTFMNTFNPVSSATLLQTIMPTAGDPVAMISEEKTWFGGDLMPGKSPYGRPKPDSQRFWKSVSPASKFVAQSLNRMTGGDTVKKGLIDVSPESLDLIVDTYTGSAGRFIKDTLNLPIRAARGDISPRRIPMVRRFYGEQFEGTDSNLYRERVADVMTLHDQIKVADKEEIARLKTDKKFKLILLARASEKRLRKLRDRRKAFEARNKDATAINEEIDKIRTRFIARYEEIR
ncbi:MAG: hypothetical protein KAV87_07910, partial [Desulfobacteraceae bacterium]|nr:hypothetical protein [Desulfobacteraceae bacterium]